MRRRIVLAAAVVASFIGRDIAHAQAQATADVDSLVERTSMLRRTNRKADALDEIRLAAALAPQRQDIALLYGLLQHEVHGSELAAGVDYKWWNEGRPPWREHNLTLRRNTLRGQIVARASRLARFGLVDQKVEMELYPAFRGGYGALGFGVSAGELYPRTSMSAELYKTLPSQMEGSLGYRRVNFPNPVDLTTASLGSYVSAWLFAARVYHASGGAQGTAMSLSARRYLADDGRYVGAYASAGSIHEDLASVSDFDVQSSRSVGMEAHLIMKSRWLLTARQSLGRDALRASGRAMLYATQLQLGARF